MLLFNGASEDEDGPRPTAAGGAPAPVITMAALVNRFRSWMVGSRTPSAPIPSMSGPATGVGVLEGQHVLVTGAGRNIGRAMVLEMLRQGAQVAYTDRDPRRCAELQAELTTYAGRARGFVSDVSKPVDNVRLVEALDQAGFRVDVLVNNAVAPFAERSPLEFEWEEYRATFDTNVIGPAHLTKLVAERMVHGMRAGSIVFLLSLHAHSVRRSLTYSASKAALVMIVRELAADLAAHRIRVNGIEPGWVWSTDAQAVPHRFTPLYQSSVTPDYVARAACFLASDHWSHHTTGAILRVDGGLSLFNHIVADSPAFRRP